jgi:flagellar biosynthesis/type III secretory pathway M-ring protein FliF/YscJ
VAGGFFLLRRRTKPKTEAVAGAKVVGGAAGTSLPAPATNAEKMQAALAERAADQEAADLTALAGFKLPTITTRKSEILVRELRETAKKDASIPAQVLQTWIRGNA